MSSKIKRQGAIRRAWRKMLRMPASGPPYAVKDFTYRDSMVGSLRLEMSCMSALVEIVLPFCLVVSKGQALFCGFYLLLVDRKR